MGRAFFRHWCEELPGYPSAWLHPGQPVSVSPGEVIVVRLKYLHRDGRPPELLLLTSLLQLAIVGRTALAGVQRAYRSASHIRRHCAIVRCCSDPRRIESNAPRLFRQWRARLACIPTSAICATLQLPIRLRVAGRSSHMGHNRDANELLEIPGDESGLLSQIIRDFASGYCSLARRRMTSILGFCYRFSQILMNNRMAIAVQNAAQVIEGTAYVDVGNIDVPVLMRLRRLLETGPFARRL